jgi:hypothetical protein
MLVVCYQIRMTCRVAYRHHFSFLELHGALRYPIVERGVFWYVGQQWKLLVCPVPCYLGARIILQKAS